jgi:adenylate kinase family enzyme
MSSGLVVCFSGRIGSGKTSITQILSTALGWSRAGFGDYLRARIAREGGDPNSRQALQDLGQSLVDADPNGFCLDVLKSGDFQPGGNLLLDGIRHVDIKNRVTKLVAPSHTILVHLTLDDAELLKRIESRPQGSTDLARAETHRVESELVSSLPQIADRVVDASPSIYELAENLLSVIAEFGVEPSIIAQARTILRTIPT